MVRRCAKCGQPHVSDKEWKNTCFPCWKSQKGYAPTTGDEAYMALQEAYAELEGQKPSPPPPPPPPRGAALSQETIRDLIVLCHPDKHKDSPRATRITQWLIDQRH